MKDERKRQARRAVADVFEPHALQPDFKGFPVNAENDFQRQEGDRREGFQKRAIGEFDTPAKVPGGEDDAVIVESFDDNLKPVTWRDDAKNITEVHVHEGRDIKALSHRWTISVSLPVSTGIR